MMKILHILAWVSRSAGGLFESVPGLTKGLAKTTGCEVHVMGVDDPFSGKDRGKWHPVGVHAAPVYGPRRLCYAPGLRGIIKRVAPDIMHSHAVWTWPAKVVNEYHKAHSIPYVLSTRGSLDAWALRQSRVKKALALSSFQLQHFRKAACIHALCESEAHAIRAYGLMNPIAIIPNGVEMPVGSKGTGGSWQLAVGSGQLAVGSGQGTGDSGQWAVGIGAAGRKVLLFMGRVHPKKGLIPLVQAWKAVGSGSRRGTGDRGQRGWTLMIAGPDEGGHLAEVKQCADDLGLTYKDLSSNNTPPDSPLDRRTDSPPSDLCFLGPQYGTEKNAWLNRADAFILPSFSEGLPMAVLEAWAYGLPVVMTPECNLPEGFAADAALRIDADKGSIAQGLNALFEMSDADRVAMGVRGRSLVEQRFTWSTIAAQMVEVYDWVLGGGAVPGTVFQ